MEGSPRPDGMGASLGIYALTLSESHPNLSKGLWAYQTFIVREACRSNGRGWQEYDAMFRQQQASAADLRWGSVNNALYAVTFAAPQPTTHERSYHRATTVCKWCQEPDHQSVECALAQNLPNRPPTELRRNTRQLGSLSSRACFACSLVPRLSTWLHRKYGGAGWRERKRAWYEPFLHARIITGMSGIRY